MIEFQDGTVRISAGASAKVNRGNYNMEDSHASISVEGGIPEDASLDDVIAEARGIYVKLETFAKLSVAADLGLEVDVDNDGAVTFQFSSDEKAAPKPKRSSGGSQRGGGQRSQRGSSNRSLGGQSRAKDMEIVEIGGTDYYDVRPLKEDGTYKPNAADFQGVSKADGSLWLYGKDGSLNDDVVDLLSDAGIEY